MARHLIFYGASDDLFEIEGSKAGEPDEIDPSSAVKIMAGDIGLIVVATYAPANAVGCWAIGICQIEEDQPLPDWPMKFTTGAPSLGYSVVLTIEAPDDAVMTELRNHH